MPVTDQKDISLADDGTVTDLIGKDAAGHMFWMPKSELATAADVAAALEGKQSIGSATVAAGSTTDIGAAAGNETTVTGDGDIFSFGSAKVGTMKLVTFTGTPVLKHNPTAIVLVSDADIAVSAGDRAAFVATTNDVTTVWKLVGYLRKSGKALTPPNKADVGLDQVDNTPDTGKPVSNPQQEALDEKQFIGSATIAAAATTDIGAVDAAGITISGAETITSFGNALPGTSKTLYFAGNSTVVHGASIALPNSVDFSARHGDVLQVTAYGTLEDTIWRAVGSPESVPTIPITPSGYVFAVVDGFGLVAFGIEDDGTVRIASLNGKNVDELLAETNQAKALIEAHPAGYKLAVVDQYGRAAFGVKDDGTLAAASMELTFLNGVSVASIVAGNGGATNYRSRFPSEINMVLSYGQSLSVGADGTPAISLSQRFDNLRFAGGVRTQDSGEPYTSFVPLVEQDNSGNGGETPIAGATDMIKELIAAEDALVYTDHSFQLLGSAPGAGGTAIAGLSSGTGAFNRFVADVQAGYNLAQSAGKSFKVGAFFWTQAESDYINSTPKATYKTALVQLRNDLEAQVQAITGQSEPLACISYQVQGHATYGHAGDPYLAVAQLEVARENANHYVACPLYWSPQSVHQSAQNYKRLGAYYGLAYKRIVIDGEDWKPVMPVQIDRQGTIILVRFNVPKGPLVLDTAFRAMQANYGFSVVDSEDAAVTINSVAVVEPDTVKIVTATAAAGGRLRYGTGNGGNLRDSQGETIIFNGGGQNFPLHNWCVIFDEALI